MTTIVRVYADATARPKGAAWGAVVMVEGKKPHIMCGRLRSTKYTPGLEQMAVYRAESSARKWLKRHKINVDLLVMHTDNQPVADLLAGGTTKQRLAYRWMSREHPSMKIAHRVARWALS